jgi:excisionase family DNA binding protein
VVTDTLSDKDQTGWPTVRRLYTVQQAADATEEPIEEICRRIRSGELKVYHLGGGRVRIDEADLLANIEPRELEW